MENDKIVTAFSDDSLQKVKNTLINRVKGFAEKIAPLYLQLRWVWALDEGGVIIPDKEAIEKALMEMIDCLKPDNGGYFIETGGLLVGYKFERPNHLKTFIKFSVDSIDYLEVWKWRREELGAKKNRMIRI